MTTSPGKLFQHLTIPSVTIFLVISHLNFPWGSFRPFPHVLSAVPREKRSTPPTLLHIMRKLQTAMRSHLSLLLAEQTISLAASHKLCPLVLSPSPLPSSGHSLIFLCFSYIMEAKSVHSAQGEAIPMAGQSLL